MRGKKSTFITTLTIIITIISLVSCFGVLGISNSVQGVSIKKQEVWEVNIDKITNLAMDEGAIEVINCPNFEKFKINYGIKLKSAPSVAQFEFMIKNDGNIDAIVSNIQVKGLEQYANNVTVTFTNLNVGDEIKHDTFVQVKVITSYNTQVYDDLMIPQELNLDNIEIDIKLDKKE